MKNTTPAGVGMLGRIVYEINTTSPPSVYTTAHWRERKKKDVLCTRLLTRRWSRGISNNITSVTTHTNWLLVNGPAVYKDTTHTHRHRQHKIRERKTYSPDFFKLVRLKMSKSISWAAVDSAFFSLLLPPHWIFISDRWRRVKRRADVGRLTRSVNPSHIKPGCGPHGWFLIQLLLSHFQNWPLVTQESHRHQHPTLNGPCLWREHSILFVDRRRRI